MDAGRAVAVCGAVWGKRYLISRPIPAVFILIATVAIVVVQLAEANADDLAVGNQLALWELVRPDRFGWPAVFTCRRRRGDTTPAVVFANDPDEMNERLLVAGIWPEDCHGGFSIRSTRTHPGKLDDIEGNVLEPNRGPRGEYTDKATFEARQHRQRRICNEP